MKLIFESNLPRGFIDFYESKGTLFAIAAFNRKAQGVPLEIPPEEAADLAEALLRGLDDETRTSVIEAVSGEKGLVGRPIKVQAG